MTGSEGFDWGDGVRLPKPRHGNAIPGFKVKRIAQLDQDHEQLAVIAERIGVTMNTVSRYLRLLGRPLRHRVSTEDGHRVERVLRLKAEKMAVADIAERLGILRESVTRYMRLARQMGFTHLKARSRRVVHRRVPRANRQQP